MDKLKYIKLENEDGSYSSSIPLAVDGQYVDINGTNLTTVLSDKVDSAELSAVSSEINVQKSRIDNLAHLEEGSTTGDAELIDGRVDFKGENYQSVGEHLRAFESRINNLYNEEKDLNPGWESGSINTNTGADYTPTGSTPYIRTKGYFSIEDGMDYFSIFFKNFSHFDMTLTAYGMYLYEYNADLSFNRVASRCAWSIVPESHVEDTNVSFPYYAAKPDKFYRLVLAVKDNESRDIEINNSNVLIYQKQIKDVNTSSYHLINERYNGTINNVYFYYSIGSTTHQPTFPAIWGFSTGYPQLIIPVKPGEKYYTYNTDYVNCFLTKDKEIIACYSNSWKMSEHYCTVPHIVEIPENCAYWLHNIQSSSSSFIVTKFIKEDNTPLYSASKAGQKYANLETLEILDEEKVILNKELDDKVSALGYVKEIPPYEQDSVLKGKTINCLGDSITSTNYTRPCWGEIIADRAECTVNNYGISATTLAHTDDRHWRGVPSGEQDPNYDPEDPSTWSTGNCFVERYVKMTSDADAIVVMGGTNDSSVKLGEWASTNLDDFYGALNTLMTGLCNNYPGKPILFCTMMQARGDYTNNEPDPLNTLMGKSSTSTLSLRLRAEAIKAKCRQYGIPCLDLYNESGINGADTDKVYYRPSDNLHPSAYGQLRLANLIQNKLEELLQDYNAND